jgi:6-phosphogluconolactonase (cycloisomerase 2 family)
MRKGLIPVPIYHLLLTGAAAGMRSSVRRALGSATLALSLVYAAGCTINNSAPGGYTVSGTVSGLASGQQVTLADNGTDTLKVTAGGAFTFQQPVTYSQPYSVTIATQPSGQTCSVANGSGSSFSYNITNVSVVCTSTTYQIGGTVSGLAAGGSVTLVDNGTDTLAVSVDGNFNFAAPLIYDQTYAVTISTQPKLQTCAVTMGSGTVTADVSTIAVNCAYDLEPVSTIISGLESNATLRLLLNGGDTLPVSANGTYTFTAKDAYASPFAVTIGTQPPGQTCSVEGGVGTVMGTVTVPVVCTNNPYTIGGTVSGLSPNLSLTLTDTVTGNDSAMLIVSANGAFTFPNPLNYTNTYAVTVTGGQPAGENCIVQNGTGTVMTADVSNIIVTCLTRQNVYVVNNAGPPGNVALFNMNAGQLAALATAATGNTPLSIALDPSFHYAYVANQSDGPPGDISEYIISPVDGSLSPLSTPTITSGVTSGPQFVAVSPLGKAVYALNGADGTISQYTLGRGTGILASMTPATVPTGALGQTGTPPNPIAMAINSAGTFGYVVNQGDNSVSEFSIAASGALTLIATTPTGNGPNAVAISPNGRYLYVTNGMDTTISEFSITSGALTALLANPASVVSGGNPTSVVVDPTDTYVFVSDSSSNIDEYTIGTTDGSLSANTAGGGGGTIGTNATSNKLAFDQTGMFLFSADNNGNVDQFDLTPLTGVLVSVGTSVSAGSNAASIATAYFPPR